MPEEDPAVQAARLRVRLETDRMFGVDFAPRPRSRREPAAPGRSPAPAPAASPPAPVPPAVEEPLAALAQRIRRCRRCPLSKTRTRAVPGEGPARAELVFVGEAPGADEDREGRPFVGRAGQLLTRMIEAMGLKREDVFIANVLKCRPPDNRDPQPSEVAACLPYLEAQIAALHPRVLVALGRHALQALVDVPGGAKITALRGTFVEWRGVPLMPTFHPAYLLRNEAEKKKVWADLKKVLEALGRRAPARRGRSKSP